MNKKLLDYMVATGQLLPRYVAPKNIENTVKEPEKPMGDSPLRAAIRALTQSGEHPLIQSDILDAATLLHLLQVGGTFPWLTAWSLAQELRSWYFRPLGLMSGVPGQKLNLWTSLQAQPLAEIKEKVRQRLALSIKAPAGNQFTTFERDVLSLRLRRQGLRYLRPREVAVRLGCHPSAVYAASQGIARKLGIPSIRDTAALREAVCKSGALMDDPAFQ